MTDGSSTRCQLVTGPHSCHPKCQVPTIWQVLFANMGLFCCPAFSHLAASFFVFSPSSPPSPLRHNTPFRPFPAYEGTTVSPPLLVLRHANKTMLYYSYSLFLWLRKQPWIECIRFQVRCYRPSLFFQGNSLAYLPWNYPPRRANSMRCHMLCDLGA